MEFFSINLFYQLLAIFKILVAKFTDDVSLKKVLLSSMELDIGNLLPSNSYLYLKVKVFPFSLVNILGSKYWLISKSFKKESSLSFKRGQLAKFQFLNAKCLILVNNMRRCHFVFKDYWSKQAQVRKCQLIFWQRYTIRATVQELW